MWHTIDHLRDDYKEDIVNHFKNNYKEDTYTNTPKTSYSCPA